MNSHDAVNDILATLEGIEGARLEETGLLVLRNTVNVLDDTIAKCKVELQRILMEHMSHTGKGIDISPTERLYLGKKKVYGKPTGKDAMMALSDFPGGNGLTLKEVIDSDALALRPFKKVEFASMLELLILREQVTNIDRPPMSLVDPDSLNELPTLSESDRETIKAIIETLWVNDTKDTIEVQEIDPRYT